ncbi:MAG: ATP-binding cassette domain-containing protein [Hyphomicrobiaceae bacterium]
MPRDISSNEQAGIPETALQRAKTQSGGHQQRVAICRVMMQSQEFILADEQVASLDPLNARLVMDASQTINREQEITVIWQLHTLDTASRYCDNVIGMRAGSIGHHQVGQLSFFFILTNIPISSIGGG